MITDLRDYPADSELEADMCIVGTGPAGIALAFEFAGSDVSVLLLEAGGLELDPGNDELNEVECIGLPHRESKVGRARAFGGAGKLWAGQCLRLDRIDFERRDWVPSSGWPITPEQLDPFYERAESFFRVSGEVYDQRNYVRFGIDPPRWNPSSLASMFTVYTPELDVGLAWRSRLAEPANVRLVLHANVVDIRTTPNGAAVSLVQVQTLEGKRAQVRAKTIVLCAGGLENARLLLAARQDRPHGLGNDTDQVGRYFQEHPNTLTATISLEHADLLQSKFRMLYGKDGRRYFPKFRLGEATQRKEEVLNCNASLLFEYPEDSGIAALQEIFRAVRDRRLPDRPVQRAWSLLRHAGEVGQAIALRARSGQSPSGKPSAIQLQCYLEQAPNPESRITLSNRKDKLGTPVLAVDWDITALELKTLRVLTDTVRNEFDRLGLGAVQRLSWLDEPGWELRLNDCAHHCGTTRMAETAATGVVNADCEVFGVQGLYVCGSSVFPTAGYANPTLTIVALAIRLADRLKAYP